MNAVRPTQQRLFGSVKEDEIIQNVEFLKKDLTKKAEVFCIRYLLANRERGLKMFSDFIQLDVLVLAARELHKGATWDSVWYKATEAYGTFEKEILGKLLQGGERLHQAKTQATAEVDTRVKSVQGTQLHFPDHAALMECLKSRISFHLLDYSSEKGLIAPFANAEIGQQELQQRVVRAVTTNEAGSQFSVPMINDLVEGLEACSIEHREKAPSQTESSLKTLARQLSEGLISPW
jgi:hypothetical protein